MYQVTIFDNFHAILHREHFGTWFDAMTWMIEHCTKPITYHTGQVIIQPSSWELSQEAISWYRSRRMVQ